MRYAAVFLVCLIHVAPASAAPPTPEVAAIAAHYRAWLPLHPLAATSLGLHDPKLDSALPPIGAARDRALLAELDAAEVGLDAAAKSRTCDASCRFELEIVRHDIDAERFEISTLRASARYADSALDLVAQSVFSLIKRDFAPLAARAEYSIARLDAAPRLLDQALALLRESRIVTRASIDIARQEVPDTASFLERDVPAAFDALSDADVKRRVHAAGKRAADALRAYGKALDTEIAPHALTDFSLGEKIFTGLIGAEEMIDEPLPSLLARGQAELSRLQAAFRQVARTLDPKKDPRALQRELGHDHVAAKDLLADVRARLTELRRFVVEHDLVGIPTEQLPKVEETPPFMRATTQASMDTPGPYEPHATEAYYHVTLPDPSWDAARTEDYLSGAFNRSLSDVVSIHEALPGHYVQLLWVQKLSSQARRMAGNGAYLEGWAHYCEEMMLDAGWGGEQGKSKLRLAQLSDALLRAARYVVAIRMHASAPGKAMTIKEAERFFEEEGFQSHEVAVIEAKRGTGDPLFFHYTWGKLELKKLRDELRARWGAGFTLRRFHDAILAEGPIPLPLLRRALLTK